MTAAPDSELLGQFTRTESEAVFAEIVHRHIGLVHSVALRHTDNPGHAQEITQAVFIILARKAASLGRKTVLSGWLYHTARLTAANYRRAEQRRVRREQEAYMQSTLQESPANEVWREIAPLLDDAMARLGTTDRDAVVLRYFENKSLAEVGRAMGVEERAAQKRVARALEKLRSFFSRRGITLSAALLAGAVSANSVQAAPAGLAATIAVTATNGGAISAALTTLVKGTIEMMTWLKLKFAIGVGVVTILAGGTATVVVGKLLVTQASAQTAQNQQYVRPGIQNSMPKERFEYLKAKVWPEERRVERERIEARQKKNETVNAVTIDLKPYINTKRNESAASPIGLDEDTLEELPAGTNIYAGVPFDVEGSIQLMGEGMTRYAKTYPTNVNDIQINRACKKLHLLHGSNWTYLDAFGKTVAKLVLHYADGSTNETNMVAGDQVFDWWYPLFKTSLNPRNFRPAPGTERAWTGSNPFIRRVWPGESLILYKSTFDNPRPGVAITSMDYVSTMTLTAPFLVALTVE